VPIATYGMLGLVSSTGMAWLLDMDCALLHSGLFGYNGILVGLCLATFQHPEDSPDGWDAMLVAPVIVYAAFSTIIWYAFKSTLHIDLCIVNALGH
jgi:urea transporter